MHGREAWCVQKRGVVGMVAIQDDIFSLFMLLQG